MNELLVGIARRDMTPPAGSTLFGYPTIRLSHQTADKLSVTALVLQSGETAAAIVSLDWCLIDEEETALTRSVVSEATGIPPGNITLCCTHTHSGPVTVTAWGWGEKDASYLEAARKHIVEAVTCAQEALQPVRVAISVTQTDTGINRREVMLDGSVQLGMNPWGPRDRDLTVVQFANEKGPVAQIVHLGAHPTSRGTDPQISRDWPGVMMDRIETVTGVPVLFINGAFGDVAPRTSIGGAVGDGLIASQEVGLRAANDALRAFADINDFRILTLQTLSGKFELPFAPLPPPEEAERQFGTLAGHENARGADGCDWNYWNAVRRAHRAPARSGQTFNQTITRLGPLVMVPFAGEVFSEIGLRLKKASPFANTLVAGVSNGSHGYYVTREARGRGGYEVWVARAYGAYLLADNIDDVLVRENMRLLNELAESRGPR